MESKIEKSPAELLQPNTTEEKRVWEEIEGADKPIQITLKRLNRILKSKFPNTDIETTESCSGHVKRDGSVAYRAVLPEFKKNKRPKNPSIFLTATKEKVSEAEEKDIKQSLENILSQAILETNNFFNKEVISHEEVCSRISSQNEEGTGFVDKYVFTCRSYLLEDEKAFDILQKFWENFSKALSKYDNLKINESYRKEDFFPEEPTLGLVRPE